MKLEYFLKLTIVYLWKFQKAEDRSSDILSEVEWTMSESESRYLNMSNNYMVRSLIYGVKEHSIDQNL